MPWGLHGATHMGAHGPGKGHHQLRGCPGLSLMNRGIGAQTNPRAQVQSQGNRSWKNRCTLKIPLKTRSLNLRHVELCAGLGLPKGFPASSIGAF